MPAEIWNFFDGKFPCVASGIFNNINTQKFFCPGSVRSSLRQRPAIWRRQGRRRWAASRRPAAAAGCFHSRRGELAVKSFDWTTAGDQYNQYAGRAIIPIPLSPTHICSTQIIFSIRQITRTINRSPGNIWSEIPVRDYDQQADINGKNNNHRVNMRVDYALDESNFFTVTPRAFFSRTIPTNQCTECCNLASPLDSSFHSHKQQIRLRQTANSLSGHVLFKHKFNTPGRTISLDMNISESLKNSSG